MPPLNIAILWHFHQPYYKKENEFILPWVRLHGVKDYYDLPFLFQEFPKLKHTINLVPSLLMQIDDYINGSVLDKIQKLTLKDPADLSKEEKSEIARLFFLCNYDNMIAIYPRYKELYEKAKNREKFIDFALDQEWLDLQLWYNLSWFGYFSRQKESIKKLFDKGKNFTDADKILCLKEQKGVLRNISPLLETLAKNKHIELSCSPLFHPILPLLCDSRSAKETLPNVPMPEPIFRFPQDAFFQIEKAKDFVNKRYGIDVQGLWPSEGSISNEALKLIAEAGFKWAASDEEVLANSDKDNYRDLDKYFPRKLRIEDKEIKLIFRDHQLSDAIGFVYSRWNPKDAAQDFCNRLRDIKQKIVSTCGEDALNYAVVPIILDGENCWEYYKENGVPFCRELFEQLSNENEFRSLCFSEAANSSRSSYLAPLESIQAGSWIDGNFDIWIDGEENRVAWSHLALARKKLEEKKELITKEKFEKAINLIYIAEGSDWFWWYCPRHNVENKSDFDMLFRWYLRQVYEAMEEKSPDELNFPIGKSQAPRTKKQTRAISSIKISGKKSNLAQWEDAAFIELDKSFTDMQQVGEILKSLRFAETENYFVFAFEFQETFDLKYKVILKFSYPIEFSFSFEQNKFNYIASGDIELSNIEYASDEIIELLFSKESIAKILKETGAKLQFSINTITGKANITYPRVSFFEMELRS